MIGTQNSPGVWPGGCNHWVTSHRSPKLSRWKHVVNQLKVIIHDLNSFWKSFPQRNKGCKMMRMSVAETRLPWNLLGHPRVSSVVIIDRQVLRWGSMWGFGLAWWWHKMHQNTRDYNTRWGKSKKKVDIESGVTSTNEPPTMVRICIIMTSVHQPRNLHPVLWQVLLHVKATLQQLCFQHPVAKGFEVLQDDLNKVLGDTKCWKPVVRPKLKENQCTPNIM